jgi:excisionase family DNA binding protein
MVVPMQYADPQKYGLNKPAYVVNEVLAMGLFGRSKLYELAKQGDLKIVKLGRKSLIYASDLAALLDKLRDRMSQAA